MSEKSESKVSELEEKLSKQVNGNGNLNESVETSVIESEELDESMEAEDDSKTEEEEEEQKDEEKPEKKLKKKHQQKIVETDKDETLEIEGGGRGKRDKKKVERLDNSTSKKEKEIKPCGSGTSFGDIPFIRHMIEHTKLADLKLISRVLIGQVSKNKMKNALLEFNGVSFAEDDAKYEAKKRQLAVKIHLAELKEILDILGIEKKGTKVEIVKRVLDFLLCPKDFGRKIPESKISKKKRRSSQGSKTKKTKQIKKKKPTDKKSAGKKTKKNKEESESEQEESDNEEENSEEEEQKSVDEDKKSEVESSESEQDTDNEVVKKKTVKRAATKQVQGDKKNSKPKIVAKKPVTKNSAAKAVKKPAPKRARSPPPSLSSTDESDDDIPLKKMKKADPTETEIAEHIRSLLTGADLEQVTMKKLCQQVYDHYPSFDLTSKKDFIKNTVKEILT